MKSKQIEVFQNGQEFNQEYQFNLLEEFNDQQMIRCRPYLPIIDRHEDSRPYIENRVILSDGTEMSASFIQLTESANDFSNFIATQAPFKHNISAFWQMIIEKRIDQIVMVTELIEARNLSYELANLYWIDHVNETLVCENGLKVSLIEKNELFSDMQEKIQIRKFRIECLGENKIVTHYWYRNWMDNAAPNQIETILTLVNTVENHKSDLKSTSPIMVHCSAGVGRTGVFIALYYLMQQTKHNDQKINLFDLIAYLRWQRPWMVCTLLQYKFCCDMLNVIQERIALEPVGN